MASTTHSFRRRMPRPHRLATAMLATFATLGTAQAQTADPPAQRITVTGTRGLQPVGVAGFGDAPLSQLPLSATVITRSQLADAGIASLADITRLDADITDAYNAPGYIHQLAVRGFTLDNRSNVRRDGLPINAETAIGQANKQALELLKGTSGLQAGISAPAGLLNLVVKRPSGRVREASLAWVQPGTLEAALDLGDRVGGPDGLGWRLNAAGARLDPQTRDSRGSRHLLAAAFDGRVGGFWLEAEIETSRQSQPSTPGFSLRGSTLPDPAATDPRLNLNNQAWTLPVVFAGTTGSIRASRDVGSDTQLTVHLMRQSLRTEDRIAFPYGCSAENAFDRYCSDGGFDLYDFRSENERRTTDAGLLQLQSRLQWGGLEHRLGAGVLASRHSARFERQAFNFVGSGTADGRARVPADPALTDENTDRDERSTEWFIQDQVTLAAGTVLWAGARHTVTERRTVRTDGSRPTDIRQHFTTPWLALSHTLTASPGQTTLLYLSTGQGVESEVAPNRARYVNAGQALPALKSRQIEAGLKHRRDTWEARIALFDIRRPVWEDVLASTGRLGSDGCSNADPCLRRADGEARHRGIEAETGWQQGPLSLRVSAMRLWARRDGSSTPSLNGLRPNNVPDRSLKAQAAWNLAAVPGLSLLGFVTHEGRRSVLPDNSIRTPGWTRLDIGLRWAGTWQAHRWVLRASVDNATDRRAWQETPYQFGHAYLYPLQPRTVKASVETRF
jgi:iron complex outermembrane receptor protein